MIKKIVILAIFCFVCLYLTSKNRVYISSFISRPSSSYVKKNNIKEITIEPNSKLKAHFKKLYESYDGHSIVDTATYSKLNKWKKAKLTYNSKTYEVKIKAHGKSPLDHKFGNHISFRVKMKKNQTLFGKRKLTFIIYNRIQLSQSIISSIADPLGIPTPNAELVNVKFNNNSPYYYYLEEKVDKDFFKDRKLPWIHLRNGHPKSFIKQSDFELEPLNKQTERKIKSLNLTKEKKKILSNSYKKLNNAIQKKNAKDILNLLDYNYILNVNSFRYINGDSDHGFGCYNFIMCYDTLSNLFYPIVNRDNWGFELPNKKSLKASLDKLSHYKIDFFQTIDSDSTFHNDTKIRLLQLINKHKENIIHSLESDKKELQEAHFFDFSHSNNGRSGKRIIFNMEYILKHLEKQM